MPRFGDGLDAVTAFTGAAVAGMSLFLPFTYAAEDAIDSPYQVTSLVNSVPRAAALGLIVAVVLAVMVRPVRAPGLVWLTATCGALALGINHVIGNAVTSANVLTTQNYLDSLFGGVVFGALGICALRRRWSAFGFGLGAVTVFVYGEVVAVFTSNTSSLADKAVHTPTWLIAVAIVCLIANTLRHRHGVMLPAVPRLAADLPITPIVATTVLALSLLLATEWLAREFDGRRSNGGQIAIAVAVTILAALVAALLLPGRDGTGLLLAVSVAATADSLSDATNLGWSILLVFGAASAGILTGLRWSKPAAVLLGAAAVCVLALVAERLPLAWGLGAVSVSALAGYTFGATRVSYLPSAVLALGALYLPSILWSIPTRLRQWPSGATPVSEDTPAAAALAITAGAGAAIALLYRIRPRAEAAAR
ncbi:hypothetical protein [Nocardia rhizosphaerae]|uniref:Uncharacterized protein n=1 Tax=Nocardia rhizosphaerae TaxID=1691571 RepID=A0ABV8L630_9NOCA